MIILALDLALSKTGVAILDNFNLINYQLVDTRKLDTHEEQLLHIYSSLNEIINKYKPDVIIAESSFMGRNPQTLIALANVHGVAKLACSVYGKRLEYLAPQSIRKWCLDGYSNKDENGKNKTRAEFKKEVALAMTARYDLPKVEDDITDSISVGIAYLKKNNI